MCEVVQFFAQLRTWTTHKHRSWNVPIAHETYELVKCTNPAIATRQSVQNEKRPFQKNFYRMAQTCKNVHIMHVRHTEKTCRGVANCWKLFQVGQRIPRQIIWTYLSLSASTLNMTEHNSVKNSMANSNPTGKPISTKLCYRCLRLVGTNESTHSWSWVYSVEGWSHNSFHECGQMDYGSFRERFGNK